MTDYKLLDSGGGRKLERFGSYIIDRPSLQAMWRPKLSCSAWKETHAVFTREPEGFWKTVKGFPGEWVIQVRGIKFKISPTEFGHLGIFPEQQDNWEWIKDKARPGLKVLNLFAYSGGSTLAAALSGASVTHLDASKKMVAWAKDNACLNGLEKAPIRWIIDDAGKFLKREIRRGRSYDALILDPPSFGRGPKGEVFKIENHLLPLLEDCKRVLSPNPAFILLTGHSLGFTPTSMRHLLSQFFYKGAIESSEMILRGFDGAFSLPCGSFARWSS